MEQNVVNLRVQVIDIKSFALDLQVPTYLPGRDVTQRIARDAGLDAYWPDKRRRLYWLRARGRLVKDDEKLSDLGVIDGELVYLLPEPPQGSGVIEQQPEFPETHPYAGAGYLVLLGSLVGTLLWAVAWGIAVANDRSLVVVLFPGLALGLLCGTLARHTWGGRSNRVLIPMTGLALQIMLSVFAFISPMVYQYLTVGGLDAVDYQLLVAQLLPGVIVGMFGVLMSWLAWWGAVEPLPPVQLQQQVVQQVAAIPDCGICGRPVEVDVRSECAHNCGKVFHVGCFKARQANYRGDPKACVVCEKLVG